MPREDADLSAIVVDQLRDDGVRILTDYTPVRVTKNERGITVSRTQSDGTELALSATHLLLAAGRKANTDGLGLDAADVQVTKRPQARATIPAPRMARNHPCLNATL